MMALKRKIQTILLTILSTGAPATISAATAEDVVVSDSLPATSQEADSVEAMSAAEAAGPYTPVPAKTESAGAKPEGASALTAADMFVSAPAEIFPTIDPMTRMDMIDYFRAGSEKASKNLIGGECRIIEDTADKLSFTTSDVSEYSIIMLEAPGRKPDRIIMLARTLKTPAEDSTIRFFDTGWNEIKGIFKVPALDDWLLPEGRKRRDDVENAVPFVLARLQYFPELRKVTFTNNLSDYLPEESLGIAETSIRKTLTFRWTGKSLVLEK